MKQDLWQPISTAPRDGTYFIVYGGTKMYIINWPIGCWPGRWHRGRIHGRKEWFGAATISEGELSAWRPLPKPPAIENQLQEEQ